MACIDGAAQSESNRNQRPPEVALARSLILLMGILLSLPFSSAAAFDPSSIEKVARAYADVQPGLATHRSDVHSKNLEGLLARLVEASPPEAPQPTDLVLRRYWSRSSGKALVRLEGRNISPAIQKAAEQFASENIVDFRNFFLPLRARETRRKLLEKAEIKSHETRLEDSRTLHLEMAFSEPVNLKDAFYGTGLNLPRRSATAVSLDIDPDLQILNHLEITFADTSRLNVEIRHEKLPQGGFTPREIRITAPDGSIDDHLVTTFADVQGYRLPREQVRTVLRPETRETQTVLFTDHRINIPLPEEVSRQLK